ncbi:MAG: transcriptional repressor [Proteobacteria bacterium]|nr:transcriptional repressor [Pseudomonadota bacterium]MBU1715931.1 transcriptional repressor [Pseudomonadota bacterium]
MFKIPFWAGRFEKKNKRNPVSFPAGRHDVERDQFVALLETMKASRIPERILILDAFLSTEQHVTLSELAELIKNVDPLVNRGFLQETMEMFCLSGFAQKRTFESQETTYEHLHLGMHHDHFICTSCGHIQEFANHDLERLQIEIARDFQFHPLQHKMEIYGLCGQCMADREPNPPLLKAVNGERVEIVEILGGPGMQNRMSSMGLTVGSCLEVISNNPAGPVIVAINDTRLALDTAMANKILIAHSCHHLDTP